MLCNLKHTHTQTLNTGWWLKAVKVRSSWIQTVSRKPGQNYCLQNCLFSIQFFPHCGNSFVKKTTPQINSAACVSLWRWHLHPCLPGTFPSKKKKRQKLLHIISQKNPSFFIFNSLSLHLSAFTDFSRPKRSCLFAQSPRFVAPTTLTHRAESDWSVYHTPFCNWIVAGAAEWAGLLQPMQKHSH